LKVNQSTADLLSLLFVARQTSNPVIGWRTCNVRFWLILHFIISVSLCQCIHFTFGPRTPKKVENALNELSTNRKKRA